MLFQQVLSKDEARKLHERILHLGGFVKGKECKGKHVWDMSRDDATVCATCGFSLTAWLRSR